MRKKEKVTGSILAQIISGNTNRNHFKNKIFQKDNQYKSYYLFKKHNIILRLSVETSPYSCADQRPPRASDATNVNPGTK